MACQAGALDWRPGPESIIKAVVTLNSNHITCVNEMVNAAGIAALTGPQDIPSQKCAEFASRRDQVMAVMNAIPGVVCPRPQGAFYVFPDISRAFGKDPPAFRPHDRERPGVLHGIAGRKERRLRSRLGVRASRVRCASATPVRRRNCSRGWTGSQNSSPN
jgi:hypothetical protein